MIKNRINQFLTDQQFGAHRIDMQKEMGLFLLSMEEGLRGSSAGMEMIPTWLTLPKTEVVNEKVIVMDMGGSNVRVAVACFDSNGAFTLEKFAKYPMPGSDEPCTKAEFLEHMVRFLRPVLGESKRIGICFSYEVEILPDHDGRISRFTKEVQIPEMEGELIGGTLRTALEERGLDSDIEVVVLNDTVAALLGGMADRGDRKFDNYIGVIMGTGLNTAYIEQVGNIYKLAQPFDHPTMIINMESGGYAIDHRSPLDVRLDEASTAPGYHKFEKMIAGRYQGGIGYELIASAVAEGLFSTAFAERFAACKRVSGRELDAFLFRPYGQNSMALLCETEADRTHLTFLIRAIFDRAACLVAVALGGILTKTDAGRCPHVPCMITAEGSTYEKSKLFKDMLNFYTRHFIEDELGRYCEYRQVTNSNLIGTALATIANTNK
jgi:hexokinase